MPPETREPRNCRPHPVFRGFFVCRACRRAATAGVRPPKAGARGPRAAGRRPVHDARRTCGSLLADLDVHPRVAMSILRHARFSITMEIYTQVSSKSTREALKRLGESLDG
jgi:integrase